METRTLGSLVNRTGDRTNQSNDVQHMSFTAFLSLFSINLTYRFPTDQIDRIDVTSVENVARLSALCTPIVLDAWNEYSQSIQQVRSRSQKAA